MMTKSIATLVDEFVDAVAELRVAEAYHAEPDWIKRLKDSVNHTGWRLRDLGINVDFEETRSK